MTDPSTDTSSAVAMIRVHSRRFTILGIILIALGVLAMLFPLIASIAAKTMVGWFFLLTGAAVLYHAFQARDWSSALWSGAIGVMHIAVGVYLAFFPLTGLIGLTLLVGIMFMVQGGFETMMALRHRPRSGWVWLGFSGLASVVLGILLVAGLPGTALWALGLLLGLNFVTSGASFIALARAAS